MTKTKKATCYMCERPETSREHVPAKSIFPERKDTPSGHDYRQNLISVPSCDDHNCAKSAEDEYLMQVLAMSLGLNQVAVDHVNSKVRRSLIRNPRVANAFKTSAKPLVVHDIKADAWFRAISLDVDAERVHGVLEMNARAIYFHHHGVKLEAAINMQSNFLMTGSARANDLINELFARADEMLSKSRRYGQNPDVFYYRTDREEDLELLEFTFYGSSKVLFSITH